MGCRDRVALGYADDICASDSRLSTGDITTVPGQLPLLSNVFGLRARSLRALRSGQGRAAYDQPDPPLSPLSAGRLRSGSLNGQALFSSPLSLVNRHSGLSAAISTTEAGNQRPGGDSKGLELRTERSCIIDATIGDRSANRCSFTTSDKHCGSQLRYVIDSRDHNGQHIEGDLPIQQCWSVSGVDRNA